MTRKAYISYTRRADHSLKDCLRNNSPEGWEIRFDETALEEDRSIRGFEEEVSEADQVIFLLSEEYFESIYCIRELLKTYEKRARELLPIVVFVAGCQPNQVSEDAIVDYWNRQAEQRRPEDMENLRLACAWLLGRHDPQANGWDTLFNVFSGNNHQEIIEKVAASSQNMRRPRFSLPSSIDRRTRIREEVKRIIEGQSAFDEKLKHSIEKVVAQGPEAPEEITGLLGEIDILLKRYVHQNHPVVERERLAADTRELAGYLVLYVMDHHQLQYLVHHLNRQKNDAALSLCGSSDCAFQLIVSAISHAPALFRYYGREQMKQERDLDRTQTGQKKQREMRALMGKGELTLHERGLCAENYYDTLHAEEEWLDTYVALERQLSEINEIPSGAYGDKEDFSAAIQGFLEAPSEAYYLLLDGGSLRFSKSTKFRRELNERFPTLTQVIADIDRNKAIEKYLIGGLRSASINQKLISIYGNIQRLLQ